MGAAAEIVSMMNNKGIVLAGWGDYKGAKNCFRQALLKAQKDEKKCQSTNKPTRLLQDIPRARSYMSSLQINVEKLLALSNNSFADKTASYRPEYDEGMDNFKFPFDLSNKSRNMIGTVLFNMGRLAQNQRNFRDALGFFWESLVAVHSSGIRHEPTEVAALFCIGQIQYIIGEFEPSLATYHIALSLAERLFGGDSLEVAASLNCIGILHYVSPEGDIQAGMAALQKSLYLRQKYQGQDHVDVGTTWNNIGRLHYHDSKVDHALSAYEESLRIRKLHHRESADIAATLFKYVFRF